MKYTDSLAHGESYRFYTHSHSRIIITFPTISTSNLLLLIYNFDTVYRHHAFICFAPSIGGRSIAISMSVCLSVCSHISKNQTSKFHELPAAVTTLCTSGFEVDVMFSHNGANTVAHRQATRHPLIQRYRLSRS